MIRTATFVAALVLTAWTAALAQVPPGVSYDPEKHPNAVITYVRHQDFKAATYIQARNLAGFDPLGPSGKEAKRTSIEVAVPKPAKQKIILPDDDYPEIKVEFYPVMRQTYALNGGGELVIEAFRFPAVPIPLNVMTGVLNGAAFTPADKYWKARFGPATVPERVTVRGLAALLFDDNNQFVLFWREGIQCYVAKTTASRSDLMRIVEDLL